MNADTLIAQFQALVQSADKLRPAIAHRVSGSRQAPDEQCQILFEGKLTSLCVPAATVAS